LLTLDGEKNAHNKECEPKFFLIRTIDFSDLADVARHDRMVSLVEQMLSLHKQLPETSTPHERTALQRQIDATDGQIDGGPALWADGGGDRDCAEGEQVVLYSFPAFRIRAIKWR
jgi:hypothetical protein